MPWHKDDSRTLVYMIGGTILVGILINVVCKLSTGKWLDDKKAEQELNETVKEGHDLAKARRGRDFNP